MLKLSTKQLEAFDGIMHFLFNADDLFYVFSGVAGSGKTSIISMVTNELDKLSYTYKVLAYTGRAVSVIKNYCGGNNASTIHKLIYRPIFDEFDNIIGYERLTKAELGHFDCFIVDEASMIDEKIMQDLMSYDIPILFVGDSEQLPPISGSLNIMEHYNIHLDEIHRVAEGNPIISLSRDIRENGKLTKSMLNKHIDGNHVKYLDKRNFNTNYISKNSHDIVIVGTNRKRVMVNNMYRSLLPNWDITPTIGESVICLKNQWLEKDLEYVYNGELYLVTDKSFDKRDSMTKYTLESKDANKTVDIKVKDCSWDESCETEGYINDNIFTFGYSISAWKSQGSQFNDVLYYNENVSGFCEQRRFDYTSVTRAKEFLTVIV